MIADTSLARMNLLHNLYTQLLAHQVAQATSPRGGAQPPIYRMPLTSNPFGYLNPTGALPPHSAVFGPTHGSLSLVGGQNAGARNWFGPPPSAAGPGLPAGSSPAVRPPGPVPLPH